MEREIGVVEVLGEVEAQHLSHADGHHGVARKVKVELQRVGDDAQPDQRGGGIGQTHKGGGRAVRDPDDVGPQRTHRVRQQHFLGQTEGEQGHALLDLLQIIAVFVDMELSRDVPVFDDGPRDELGEHHHIGTEIDDVVFGLHLPAVDVDGVGKGLEGIEADAQRQGADALDRRKAGAQQAVDAADDKVRVLEIEQHPETGQQGRQQQDPADGGLCIGLFQPEPAQIVDEDESQHDWEEPDFAPAVEHQTAQEQDGVLELCGRKVIQRQRDGKKPEQKDDGAENQGVDLLQKRPMPPRHRPSDLRFTCSGHCPRRCPDRRCTHWKR